MQCTLHEPPGTRARHLCCQQPYWSPFSQCDEECVYGRCKWESGVKHGRALIGMVTENERFFSLQQIFAFYTHIVSLQFMMHGCCHGKRHTKQETNHRQPSTSNYSAFQVATLGKRMCECVRVQASTLDTFTTSLQKSDCYTGNTATWFL